MSKLDDKADCALEGFNSLALQGYEYQLHVPSAQPHHRIASVLRTSRPCLHVARQQLRC